MFTFFVYVGVFTFWPFHYLDTNMILKEKKKNRKETTALSAKSIVLSPVFPLDLMFEFIR